MKTGPKILFLDILTDDTKERKAIHEKVYKGTYSEAMRKAFGVEKNRWLLIYASENKLPQSTDGFDAIVIGGSLHDPIKKIEKPWMQSTFSFIKKAAREGMPILGICGGLQFTVRAFGGGVVVNPQGREFGTIGLDISTAGMNDKIFTGISGDVFVQSSHKCMASSLKPGWRLLASSDLCRTQAIAIGDNIRLLQFHPEMTEDQLRAIELYKKLKLSPIKNTEATGKKIIHNFLEYFVLPYHKKHISLINT